MNLVNFFDKYGKAERIEKIKKACVKLHNAFEEGNTEYIIKRLAYLEFISEQFQQKYGWTEKIYEHKHRLENKYVYERGEDE